MNLPQLPMDKANHWVYGTVIYWLGCFIHPTFALVVLAIIAGVKEIVYDGWMLKGTEDAKDYFATVAPGILFYLQWLLPVAIARFS